MEIKKSLSANEEKNKKEAEFLKIKINKFLINYFNYLIFSLIFLILAVGFFILVYPKYQQISKENEEAKNNLEVQYETKLNYLNLIRNLKKSYQLVSQEEKEKIAAMIPPIGDTGIIISEVESIAVKNSAILTSIKIEPQTVIDPENLSVESKNNKGSSQGIFNQPPEGVGLIKMEINLSSVNYSVLKNIIKSFENNLRLFDIAKILFDANKNMVVFTAYSYYLIN